MSVLPPWTAVRLSALYAAMFLVIGVLLPFWPVWLAAHGLDAAQIGVVLAVGVGTKTLGNPLVAHLADRRGERRRVIVALALAAAAAFALFAAAGGFWSILAISMLFFLAWPAIMPLGESLTMLAVQRGNVDYGRIRLWGSIAFIAAAVGAGALLEGRSPDVVFVTILAGVLITALVACLLPDLRTAPVRHVQTPVLHVLTLPGFALFLAAAMAAQSSHAVYYAFGTLHWRAAGYDDLVIGALWGLGVVAEIVLFAFGKRVLARIGPARLILIGAAAGTVRWSVTGLTTALPALLAVQILHALTFGAVHLGAIHYIARAVPPDLSATAQSLYAAAVMGLALGAMLFLAGPLYAAAGGHAYLAMAALSAVAVLLAWNLKKPD